MRPAGQRGRSDAREDGNVGEAIVSSGGNAVELDGPFVGAEINPGQAPGKIGAIARERVDAEFAAALAATPRAPQVFRLTFANAQADLDATALAVLDTAIAAARATPHVDVSVVGHTDAIGHSAEENPPLSLRRAEAVRKALIAAGIPPEVIGIAYFGASDPLVPNKPGVPEPLNRRVEITVR